MVSELGNNHTADQCVERPQNRHLRPWLPGQSGNPKGRPSAGAAVREWWNQMRDWPMDRLVVVINDPAAGSAKVAAAQQWIKAREGAGTSLDRICDRTDGKPEQPLTVGGELIDDLRNCSPDELRIIRATIAAAARRAGRAIPDAGVN